MRREKYYIAIDEKVRRVKLMEKALFGQTGGTYSRVGDYYLPNFSGIGSKSERRSVIIILLRGISWLSDWAGIGL